MAMGTVRFNGGMGRRGNPAVDKHPIQGPGGGGGGGIKVVPVPSCY